MGPISMLSRWLAIRNSTFRQRLARRGELRQALFFMHACIRCIICLHTCIVLGGCAPQPPRLGYPRRGVRGAQLPRTTRTSEAGGLGSAVPQAYAGMHIVHACYACILSMHIMNACMHACILCMHIVHACMHILHAYCACICMHIKLGPIFSVSRRLLLRSSAFGQRHGRRPWRLPGVLRAPGIRPCLGLSAPVWLYVYIYIYTFIYSYT